ncbi:MAG: hypothetical protein MZV64_24530 [Ignavibacteriales bacterium]|nr:hypothetical protein [Ignavibacteriales bacterium]
MAPGILFSPEKDTTETERYFMAMIRKSLLTASSQAELQKICTVAVFANEARLTEEDGEWIFHGDATMDVACCSLWFINLGVILKNFLPGANCSEKYPMNRSENILLHLQTGWQGLYWCKGGGGNHPQLLRYYVAQYVDKVYKQ